MLQLTAWRLSSEKPAQSASLQQWLSNLRCAEGAQLERTTNTSGQCTGVGVGE